MAVSQHSERLTFGEYDRNRSNMKVARPRLRKSLISEIFGALSVTFGESRFSFELPAIQNQSLNIVSVVYETFSESFAWSSRESRAKRGLISRVALS
ncbi:hypothetical protein Mal48_23900 [Thalassoglobus polymorphus]|uniref:Uncharacterized protein n=1 Tax=Thalassoglobus polymorphus TaxID=2527994 RepID=A0A517QNH9_9PLAN|nr:hypothetical protein Mal48_23900 [Thalassoglobus polymorphus]